MRACLLGVACAAAVMIACGGDSPSAPDPDDPDTLKSAPTTVVLAGETLVLSASLWRDFQPISPPDGKALAGVLRVTATDGSGVPSSVTADSAWVIMGAQIWQTTPSEIGTRDGTSPVYELAVRDGPKWGPGVSVHVIVRLRDGSGHAVLLRAADQVIQRTD